ncbi:hypothetical protein EPR50_G00203360 [Perca flavescens]|uniref:Uncharacterized protein n=1 Tax=Perca flavescens TaxID=8167 RepID=A0A484C415_PERFV|nr:hypothetical protein EPR50_G00203360 [Perca flavescens]
MLMIKWCNDVDCVLKNKTKQYAILLQRIYSSDNPLNRHVNIIQSMKTLILKAALWHLTGMLHAGMRHQHCRHTDCSSQPVRAKTLGGFSTAPGLPAHVWGQPGSLTHKPETLPTSSQPNSYQSCCLTQDFASTSTLKIKRCWCFPVL